MFKYIVYLLQEIDGFAETVADLRKLNLRDQFIVFLKVVTETSTIVSSCDGINFAIVA